MPDMILIRSDARHLPLADESVQCCVTSPPYWGLRSYHGDPHMIGLEPTFDEHLENLVAVFREVRRVLRKDGTCWLNYGDAYTSGGRATYRSGASDNKGHQVQDDMPRPATPNGLKPKDLMLMPARVAMALQADGWYVRSEIIWHKPNPMPESATDRPTNAHEKVFLLAKSGDKLFWTHRAFPGVRVQPEPDYVWRNRDTAEETPIEPAEWRETPSQKDPNQKMWQRVNLWIGHDYFYDAEAVRTPISPNTHNAKCSAFAPPKGIDNAFSNRDTMDRTRTPEEEKGAGANLRNVWKIPTQSVSAAHFATYPEKLVEPCILAGTSAEGACAKCGAPWARVVQRELVDGKTGLRPKFTGTTRSDTGKDAGSNMLRDGFTPGGMNNNTTLGWKPTCECEAPTVPCIVLDPFVGSGTVCRVATRLNRRGIGCDLGYQAIAVKRTTNVQRMLI